MVKNYTSIGDSFMKNFVRLSEVCTISASKANIEEECAWLLNLDKVESKTGRILEHEVVPREKLNGSIVQFDTENVLYSKLRPNLNKVVLPEENGYATSEMLPLRPCESKLTKGYLAEYLRSDNFVSWAVGKTAGAKMPRLGTKVLMDKMIPLPPLEEQHKIVSLFSVVNHVISLRQQQLAKLDELVKARFVEIFGDPFLNLMNWNKIKIANAVTVEPQNGMYKPQSNYVTDGTGTPILRIDSFYDGEVTDFSLLKRLVCNEEEKQKYALREDDIIINRVNSIEYLGKCARITGLKEETVYESNMMRMHFDSKRFNPIYIIQLLCSQFIYRQIVNHAKKAVNQASINQKDVLDFDIYEPPIELQNTFGGFVKQTEQLKLPIQKSIEQMETLKKALMQQYFG